MKYAERSLPIAALAAMVLCIFAFPGASRATEWSVGMSGGDHGIDGFHLSVGEYYDVPEREVIVIHDRGIDDDELPVVFYLSRCAHVPPEVIVDMRLRGMNWMDITFHFGLTPEIYYYPVPVYVYDHYPHGHAWGYYKKYPKRAHWRKIHLNDSDVVDQVNLRFMSKHYGYGPDRVMKYRSQGRRYATIDREIWKQKHGGNRDRYYTDRNWRQERRGGHQKREYRQNDGGHGGHGGGYQQGQGSHGHGKKDGGGNGQWQEQGHGGKGK